MDSLQAAHAAASTNKDFTIVHDFTITLSNAARDFMMHYESLDLRK